MTPALKNSIRIRDLYVWLELILTNQMHLTNIGHEDVHCIAFMLPVWHLAPILRCDARSAKQVQEGVPYGYL